MTPSASPASLGRLFGLALLSSAGLILEISLTRLFSTLFYPPYVFAILSLAVLGIGFGAALAAWKKRLRRLSLVPVYLALAGLATLSLILVATLAAGPAVRIPLFLLLLPPYLFSGLALATLFSSDSQASPRLYRADLAGAGVGALLAIPVLDGMGPVNASLLAGILMSLAGLVLALGELPPDLKSRAPVGLALVAFLTGLLLLGGNLLAGWLTVDMASTPAEKPMAESLSGGGRILRTTWDSFARTDLVDPGDGSPYRLYMDGAAGSVMPPVQNNDPLFRDIGLFPFATAPLQSVFVIGPGGGLDVWFGLLAEAEEIVAVEVNQASVDLVEAFGGYHGDLYGQPAVRVTVDEGRSVLRREQASYDLIFLSQVVTLAAERSGYALVENSTMTVEAFQDYLDHLRPEGRLALKLYDELTLTRALSTALAALRRQGLSDAQALSHVAAFLDPRSDPPIPLLIVRKTAFSADEALELGAVAQRVGFVPLFLPETWAEPPLDAVAAGLLPFSDIVARAESDISATSDDRPFFYQFERGVPVDLQPLLLVLTALLLAGTLLLARSQRHIEPRRLRLTPLYFAALGSGFMLVELAIIQQTRLFLGHPTLAVTTVLAVLLVGGGIGSGLAGRWFPGGMRSLPAVPAIAVAALVVAWMLAWPSLSRLFATAEPTVRVLVAGLSLLPLALFMGMPMPLGLRHAGRIGNAQVALAWAVNGAMTVVGSAFGVTLALVVGFSRVLLIGAIVYGLAALVAAFLTLPAEPGFAGEWKMRA